LYCNALDGLRVGFPWARVLSAAIALPLALAMVLAGGWAFVLLVGGLVFLGQREYFALSRAKGIAPAAKTTMFVSLVLAVVCYGVGFPGVPPVLADAVFPVAGTCICFYLLFQPKLASIADISASILGLFYGGFLPSFWIRLRGLAGPGLSWGGWELDRGGLYVLLAFSCIWASDIGSYVFGKWLGRTRLSNISPKKTVEGAVLGLLSCLVVALAWARGLHWPLWGLSGAVVGVVVGIASLLGDLTESMMKRDAGVKDSGQIIPGHGGILDRADSYVFTAPLVYYLALVAESLHF